MSDALGRKLILNSASLLLAGGSIVSSVRKSMAVIMLGRVLQGLGGGGLDVLSEVIVADITLKERPLYNRLLAVPIAVGGIPGPVLGAFFSELVDWRWIGWINLPLIAAGVVLSTAFLLQQWMHGLLPPLKLGRCDVLLVILEDVSSIVVQRRHLQISDCAGHLDWRLHSWHGLVQTAPVSALLLPSRLSRGTVTIRNICTPFLLIRDVLIGVAAWAVDFFRHYRWEMWVGWVFLAVGTRVFSLWDNHGSDSSARAATVGFQAIAGIGLGTIFTVPAISMQANAPTVEDQGLAIGILVSFRLFGAPIGLAIGSTTFNGIFASALKDLGTLPESIAALSDPNETIAFILFLHIVELPAALIDSVREFYAMRDVWMILAGFGALGFLTSLFIERIDLETEELDRPHYEQG
ncbi:putative Major facilitator superfamily (MFS) profile domain-containing protein [Seiridium unicorne]|uniref:Major facilitator superfamily (MFS) profile domain-containing protein n=1 Tax=Seiridium unicorne TaxID=138068 RepID=A0ABR2UGD0_9PEZI